MEHRVVGSQLARRIGLAGAVVALAIGPGNPGTAADPYQLTSVESQFAETHTKSHGRKLQALPIRIGLDAAMTGTAGQSGLAIERGARLAIAEINEAGGLLGRELELVVKNHRGIPARGIDNIEAFAGLANLVAVIGGLHTPVALAEIDSIHRHRIIYLGPWAAGTPIVDNGYQPNYVFRISARDEFVGSFLVKKAVGRGLRKPGLLLWRTGWGRSNYRAIMDALPEHGIHHAGVAWFNTSQRHMAKELQSLLDAGADSILLVANAGEGLAVLRAMAALPPQKRVPILSHWGMTGGDVFSRDPRLFDEVDLTFLQTYSFFTPTAPAKSRKLVDRYCVVFKVCGSLGAIVSPVGTAHAYDLVHILARAIRAAGTIDRKQVRAALERIDRHDGLVRTYAPPFTPDRHDALDKSDFRMSRYTVSGAIVPHDLVETQ